MKGKYLRKNFVNLLKISLLFKGLNSVSTSNHIKKENPKIELKAYRKMLLLNHIFRMMNKRLTEKV